MRVDTPLSGFVTGTKMLGRAGIIPVEKLTAGDLLWTMHHGMQPVRWIARRQIHTLADNPKSLPVQVCADAFGRGCPTDPLVLMPAHSIYINDLQLAPGLACRANFLPAQSLLDDDKVTRLTETDTLEVIHLGLDVSDVVYASGMMVQNPEDATSRPTRSPDGRIEDFLTSFPELRGLFRFVSTGSMPQSELQRAGCG
nr:Hint domain-containing protein [Cognatishimia sp. MH4019]